MNRILILFLLFTFDTGFFTDEKTYLEKGLELEREGRYEEALSQWLTAFAHLDEPVTEIGRQYIRLTTEHNIRAHYKLASRVYLWGISGENVDENRNALLHEAEMLKPLVNRNLYSYWIELIEGNDPGIFNELNRFWQQLNPAPGTEYNARLLEHWERIAYARKHFNRSDNPPYGSDDRGSAWVQYGEPNRITKGILETTRGKVIELSRRLDYGINTLTSDAGELSNGGQNTAYAELMADYVQNLDPRPNYEIWIYEQPNTKMDFNLVLIFGDKRTGGFGQVNAIDDFIPSRYFSTSRERYSITGIQGIAQAGVNLTPGMVLQFLYYEQLATTDFFFADKYSSMVMNWERLSFGDQSFGQHSGPVQIQRNQMSMMQNMNQAPEEMSTHQNLLPSIPLVVYSYRFLDDQNRTLIAAFLESRPMQAFISDFGFNQEAIFFDESVTAEEGFGYYELIHGVQVQDEDGEILAQARIPSELYLDNEENLPGSSVFTIPLDSDAMQFLFYAELYNQHPDSKPRIETTFPVSLRGLGTFTVEPSEPLSTYPDVLEMADIVLGYEMQTDPSDETLFPFVVANNRELPMGEELAVHLEIYNLAIGTEGFTDFRIEYEIVPVTSRDRPVRSDEAFIITLSQATTESRFVENLEIKTIDLASGRYLLRIETTDNLNGNSVEKGLIFTIID